MNTTRIDSANYLNELREGEPLWERHSARNFRQNVRRAVVIFNQDAAERNARRNDAPRDNADDNEDDDDDADDDCELLLSSGLFVLFF